MTTHAHKRTALEKSRVRTAKAVLLLALVCLTALTLWQCLERGKESSSMPDFASIIDGTWGGSEAGLPEAQASGPLVLNGSLPADPLRLDQEGIALMDVNSEGNILWYQSIWDDQQSRILLERSLVFQGWQSMGAEEDMLMCFAYAPTGLAAGGSLVASFYAVEDGCSILVELL